MTRPPSPDISDHHWAWFLDVDGTLLEIESRPELVSADPRLIDLLERLGESYGGAVALISGRSIEQLDRIFGRLSIAAAASHGLEQRLPGGVTKRQARELPAASVARVRAFAERHEGLVLERKPFSVSLHYRQRPDLQSAVIETFENVCKELGNGARLMHGKMVVELLPAGADKGSAIRDFMQNAPFAGRMPVFAGDDVTDEHGFEVVNELGGMSVRVGNSARSAARWQLRNVGDLRTWLQSALDLL